MLFEIAQTNKKNKIANIVAKSYSISKLYTTIDNHAEQNENPFIIGIISIPSINIKLPIISEISDDWLKTSVCRFYGPFKIVSR